MTNKTRKEKEGKKEERGEGGREPFISFINLNINEMENVTQFTLQETQAKQLVLIHWAPSTHSGVKSTPGPRNIRNGFV